MQIQFTMKAVEAVMSKILLDAWNRISDVDQKDMALTVWSMRTIRSAFIFLGRMLGESLPLRATTIFALSSRRAMKRRRIAPEKDVMPCLTSLAVEVLI